MTSQGKPPVRPGIRQLAEAIGLSVSTVSRALNGYSDVSPATLRKVERAAREMGYSANYAATALRSRQTRTVTFMASRPWTKFVDPYVLGMLDGMEVVLRNEGYDLHVVMARAFESEMQTLRRLVEQRRCDGVFMGRTRPVDERVDYLLERGFPFVTLGRTDASRHDWVDRDHFNIGKQATERLIQLGHRSIAILLTPAEFAFSQAALQGYRAGLEEAGLELDPRMEAECSPAVTGEEVFGELLDSGLRPTALFGATDVIAQSAMDGMRKRGMRPGTDVAVIGCDDIPIAQYLDPPLTTFAQDSERVGATMGEMIVSRLRGRTEPQHVDIDTRLVLRASDGPVVN